jgi:thiol-disulfide isomerase/thioredoxin
MLFFLPVSPTIKQILLPISYCYMFDRVKSRLVCIGLLLFLAYKGIAQISVFDKFDDFESTHLLTDNDTLYVINFWATWCKPCIKEMPYFIELAERMKGKKFKLLLVSLDFKNQLNSRLIPFIEEKKLQQYVVLLADGRYNSWIDRVSTEWSGAIPATLFKNGNKTLFFEGEIESSHELHQIISQF